jgi:hypothetical protein
LEIKEKFDERIQEMIKTYSHLLPEYLSTPKLEIVCGDFLQSDWSSASFVFANSTCFSAELMQQLSKKSEELKKGTIFVTFTKRIPNLSENWEVKDGFRRLMSWGIATVYVHRKIK